MMHRLYERLDRTKRMDITLEQTLEQWSRQDREYVAKNAGIPSEGIPDDALSRLISQEVLSRSGMQAHLIIATDEEIAAFERAIDAGSFQNPEDGSLDLFSDLGYIAVYPDGHSEVLRDAAQSYLLYCTEDFQKKRRNCAWLMTCFSAMYYLYGACPKKTLYLLYRKKVQDADMDAFWETYYRLPEAYRFAVLRDGRFIYHSLLSNPLVQRLGFEKEPYYIPSAEEMENWEKYGYPREAVAYSRLRGKVAETAGVTPEDEKAGELTAAICDVFRMGGMPEGALEVFKNKNIRIDGDGKKELLPLLTAAMDDTRSPLLRGFTPLEKRTHGA